MPLTPTNDQIDDQLQLLAVGRHTLSIYLRQLLSRGGLEYTPASTIAGIEQICRRIRKIKATLRSWSVPVDDHPDDDADRDELGPANQPNDGAAADQPAVSLFEFTNGTWDQIQREGDMTKKILLIDNATDYRKSLGDFLEAVGYQVLRAESVEQARALLEHSWAHVLLIDIRLRDDKDPKDESGLALAKDLALSGVPKIMLTRFPTIASVREALGASLKGMPAAVDYIDKRNQDPQPLLDAIESALAGPERINFALQISFDPASSFAALVNLLLPEHDNGWLLERCAELEDLLRKLFADSHQITLGRTLGQSPGRLTLEVFAYNDDGVERQYLVACGQKSVIAAENQRFRDAAPQAGSHTVIKDLAAETLHFAASAYMLSGDLEQIASFREFYQNRPTEAVAGAVDLLYQQTLAAWHRRGRGQLANQPLAGLLRELRQPDPPLPGAAEFGRQIEELAQQIFVANLVAAPPTVTPQQIALVFPSGRIAQIANPAGIDLARPEPLFNALRGIVHGRVDADTILVGADGQSWLSNFTRAGKGLLLHDFITLETAIKLELLDTLDLEERFEFELRLLSAGGLAAPIDSAGLPAKLQRAHRVIERIRANAGLAGAQLLAYQAGLFGCALGQLGRFQPERKELRRRLVPFAHALLLAGLVGPQLAAPPDPPSGLPGPAGGGFWLDQTNQVAWVESRRVELTAQEYQILAFLSQRAGQLCTRQELGDNVLGIEYDVGEESRLNSAISRLRLKLEPDPRMPKYLITVRGRGYRLDGTG